MAYIIDKNGSKIEIDIDVHAAQSITIYGSDVDFTEDVFMLNLYSGGESLKTSSELIAQIRMYHEPTKEEILYWFSKNNLGNTDFYTIEKGKMLTWNNG
jgi:hypothetical protein